MTAGFGAFGKIPGLGDFFRMNLPAGFVSAWDTWLQTALVTARDAIGDRWTDTYLSAPIWRFTLPAGFAGDSAVSGILMASVDRVGRQYPLTLAIPHADSPAPLVHFANRTVFERLETIALDMLEDSATKDDLSGALADATFVAPGPVAFSLPYVGELPAAQVLAADAIQATRGQCALWSAMLEGNHRLMTTRALPREGEIPALFDLAAPFWSRAGLAAE